MSKNTGTSELINYFDLGVNGDVGIAGSLDINTIANATTDTDTFLVSDTGIIKYRTGAQLLSDIGAAPATGGSYLPLTGGILTGTTRMDGSGGTVPSITMIYNSGINRLLAPLLRLYGATNEASNYIELFGTLATSNRTINFPDASGTVALTSNIPANPVGGTGTSGTIPVFTGSTTIGNSILQSNATQVNIVGNGSQLLFDSLGQSKSGGISYVNDFELLINNSRGTGSAIYLGNQNMDFHTNVSGNPRLRIESNGNLGVGTSTPTSSFNARLAVRNEDAANNPTLVLFKNINSASSEDIFRVQSWNGAFNTVASIRANGGATFSSSVTSAGVISNGNVGIGTANATGQSANNRVIQIYGAGVGNRAQIHFVNSDSGETTTDGSFIGIDFSRELYIINRESAATVFENNGSESMRITSGRNVLIGTTTDAGSKLYVNGASYLDGYNYASSIQFIRAATNTVNPAGGNGILVFAGGNAQMRMDTSNTINFDMNNAGSPFTALQIRQGGNAVQVNSPNNQLCLAIAYQGVEQGYLGATSSFSRALLAYSQNGGYVYLSSGSTWVAASDRNRKKNFESYNKGLSEICNLKPTLFNLKTQSDDEPKMAGLIAQEVGEHLQEAFNDGEFIGIDYNVLTVTIINAIKELKQQLDILKNENN